MEDWENKQVFFRLGSNYELLPNYLIRFSPRNSVMQEKFKKLGIGKLPVDFNDAVNHNKVVLRHNRPYKSHSGILWPLNDYDGTNLIQDNICWDNKQNKIFWRGGTTGHNIEHRIQPVIKINSFKHQQIDVKFSYVIQGKGGYMTGDILGDYIGMESWFNYKYILNLEGNDYSSSFPFILNSNSLALHTYPFRYETILFGDDIQPWVHFVPVKQDCSDIVEKLQWCEEHQEECKAIISRANAYILPYKNKQCYDNILCKIVQSLKNLGLND